MSINKRTLFLIKILKEAKTDNQKLAISVELNDLLTSKVSKMNVELQAIQNALKLVARQHMPESKLRDEMLEHNYEDHID